MNEVLERESKSSLKSLMVRVHIQVDFTDGIAPLPSIAGKWTRHQSVSTDQLTSKENRLHRPTTAADWTNASRGAGCRISKPTIMAARSEYDLIFHENSSPTRVSENILSEK